MLRKLALIALLALTVLGASADAQRFIVFAHVPSGGNNNPPPSGTHPAFALTTAVKAQAVAKANANDESWVKLKSAADSLLSASYPVYTISAATNANPVVFTLPQGVPFSVSMTLNIGGGTGNWTAVNFTKSSTRVLATKVDATHFSIPVNSTSFGALAGNLVVFPYGCDQGDCNNVVDYAAYSFEGFNWLDNFQKLALAYQISGNTAYSDKAKQLFDYIISLGKAGITAPYDVDQGFPARSAVMALNVGFDWLYPTLSLTERNDAVTTGNLWYDRYVDGTGLLSNSGPANDNYYIGNIAGFGIWGLVSAGDNARSTEIINAIRTKFNNVVATAFTSGAWQGGYPTEAYVYGINTFANLLNYMECIKTATGEDLFSTTTYGKQIANSLIHSLKPNKWQVPDEADYAGNFVGILQNYFPLYLSYLLEGSTEGAYMQHMYNNIADDGFGGQADYYFQRLLYKNTGRTDTDYAGAVPTGYISLGDDHLQWRSNWTTSDAWFQFNGGATNWCQQAGGSCAGHQARTAGNVEAQRGSDYFLAYAGEWKGINGVSDDGSGTAFVDSGWRANALYHDDGVGGYNFDGIDYKGGMGFWGVSVAPVAEVGTDYSTQCSDLTQAYYTNGGGTGRTLNSYNRCVTFEGSGVAMIYDRVVRTNVAFTDQDWFHINGNATTTVASGVVKSTLGASVMFLKPVYPTTSGITTAIDRPNSDRSSDDPANQTAPKLLTRVVVDPFSNGGTPTTTYQALHVIFLAPVATSAMPTTTGIISSENNYQGASFVDSSTTWVNLFSISGNPPTSTVSYSASIGSTGRHILDNMDVLTAYIVTQNGTTITQAVSSANGVLNFTSSGGGNFVVTKLSAQQNEFPNWSDTSHTLFISPTNGENFVANAQDLRWVAAGYDGVYLGDQPAGHQPTQMELMVDGVSRQTVLIGAMENWVAKGIVSGLNLSVGDHYVWSKTTLHSGATMESVPHLITILATPTYGQTINLPGNTDCMSATLGSGTLNGSSGSRIRVNGQGFNITCNTSSALTWNYVDFYNVGSTSDFTLTGTDITTSAALTITNCRFYYSNALNFVINGSGAVSVSGNLFASNMRMKEGQDPNADSQPVISFSGTNVNDSKSFDTNNIAMGWMAFGGSGHWTIGDPTPGSVAKANIFIGARVGIFLNAGTNYNVQRNYGDHIYIGGWSQASLIEGGNISSTLYEHNILMASSWPNRGITGEFRYNLVLGMGGEEALIWTGGSAAANVHHNVFRSKTGFRAIVYMGVSGIASGVQIRNNTIDSVSTSANDSCIDQLNGGSSSTVNSNLLTNCINPAVKISGGTMTTDYNAFWNNAGAPYGDARGLQAHDQSTDPKLAAPPTYNKPFDELAVWRRTLLLSTILSNYRGYYTPGVGSSLINTGDIGVYGSGNSIGAIGSTGAAAANDKFGTS